MVRALFTDDVLERLMRTPRSPEQPWSNDAQFRRRHQLWGHGPLRYQYDYSRRELWWSYLESAQATHILDKDLCQRLTSTNDDQFHGGLGEIMTSWVFREQFGLRLERHTATGRSADFRTMEHPQLRVEVKARHVPTSSNSWSGDDASVISACVEDAAKQFRPDEYNLLVIVAALRTPVNVDRAQLTRALMGDWAMCVPIHTDPNEPTHEPTMLFQQSGRLTKIWPRRHGPVHTRVSAVMVIEEVGHYRGEVVVEHAIHVAHNPFAKCKVTPSMFGEVPQLFEIESGRLAWTDHVPIDGEED